MISPGIRSFSRCFSVGAVSHADYSHVVIGGGVVGLAIAAELSKVSSNKVILLEKHLSLGQETTSRNSEVIHAGLYYPPNSLKAKFCIEGKALLYSDAAKAGVEMRQCGKWIVAQTEQETEYLTKMHEIATKILGVPVQMISASEAQTLEPEIKVGQAVLSSPTTGIISAHSFMDYLESIFQTNNGEIAIGSQVTGLTKNGETFTVVVSDISGEEVEIETENVVNSAGLYASDISNMLLERKVNSFYAKGNYFSFSRPGTKVGRLIYPCPTKNVASLGTHLTIDLGGQIKFGPDIEWVDSASDFEVSLKNLDAAYHAIKRYFPAVTKESLTPSYSGIRPKLTDQYETAFQDFVIQEEEGFKGFVNCLGIESPGLTSAMGIAKYVREIYHSK
ncbi:hypothetical protein BABINDRAFT_166249 [Babjeviella inositovora NRRL Y-12698]|uniref:L-2-hydroxyglutarate dehydrogenase, mitochondrial n=1 Tax=Babjeviella inositovora NRRL Y-12698 TaxID=984486 RepID=A0A1E3QSF9_9ASCO|nr:uncharacterized protein BABINDRAFT_166249 [Babjeviella inositovora NRRL Y-12698]ODQ80646.1 hypothetical protein BABINDRAFT_166249 [Babjeviella inositovora NRRL Y-12698]